MPLSGKAPAGQHTRVEVRVTLENGTRKDYAWSTPHSLSYALHKGPGWARRELSKEKVPGRSKIHSLLVEATYEPGVYRRT